MNRTLSLVVIIFAGMIAAAWLWQSTQAAAVRRLPALAFTLLAGTKLPTSALRDRPLLVVFWSVSCAPCVAEAPRLAAFYRELHPLGLNMVAVAMAGDPPSLVFDFTRHFDIQYPVALDIDGTVARAFGGVNAIPRAILVGPDGRIAEDHLGRVDWGQLRTRVEHMLNRPPVRAIGNARLLPGRMT